MSADAKLKRAEYDFSKGKRGAAIPQKGKSVVEEGDHRSLLARDRLYARLWAHQSDGFLGEDVAEAAEGSEEAIAQARAQENEGEVVTEVAQARKLEPTLIGHDLPAGSEPPG